MSSYHAEAFQKKWRNWSSKSEYWATLIRKKIHQIKEIDRCIIQMIIFTIYNQIKNLWKKSPYNSEDSIEEPRSVILLRSSLILYTVPTLNLIVSSYTELIYSKAEFHRHIWVWTSVIILHNFYLSIHSRHTIWGYWITYLNIYMNYKFRSISCPRYNY